MKKTLRNLGIGLAALVVPFCGGCGKEKPIETVNLSGIVINERYIPAQSGWGGLPSYYTFVMDTKYGKKAVEVWRGNKEHERIKQKFNSPALRVLDVMINPGTIVEIEIPKSEQYNKFYTVYSGAIEVLDEEKTKQTEN